MSSSPVAPTGMEVISDHHGGEGSGARYADEDDSSNPPQIMNRIRLKWNSGRGMPPIFGFFGKVTAKGRKALLNSIVLLFLNIVFITSGALIISRIENDYNLKFKLLNQTLIKKDDLKFFLGHDHNPAVEFPSHLPGHQGWTENEWVKLHQLHKQRCFKLDNDHTQNNLWNFWSAFDFCATVLTTIGYGSIYPRTAFGKIVLILYTICGIGIMAMYLGLFSKAIINLVNFLIDLATKVIRLINRRFVCSEVLSRMFSLLVVLVALTAFVIMWSFIMSSSNPRDSFLKAAYFYVITLTTVGLGDISMTEAKPFVLIRVLFLFCVGLTLVTAVFNALRSVLAAHTKRLKAKGRRLTTRAQEAMKDGANRLINRNTEDSVPLTNIKAGVNDGYDPDSEFTMPMLYDKK